MLAASTTARAQVNALPGELDGIGIDDKPGALAPRQLELKDQDGRVVHFGDYFDGKRPVLLVLAYYQCPMLCSMVLNGLTEGLKQLAAQSGGAGDGNWSVGSKYRVVTASFDARDTSDLAREKRKNQLASYGREVGPRGWDFLVADDVTIKRLADAVGFHFKWDPQGKQFAHAAGAFVFTPDGRLSRTLYGIQFPPTSLRLALLEASGGQTSQMVGGAVDRILLFCFHYDPAARGYVLFARRFMEAGGALSALALFGCLYHLHRKKSPMPVPAAPSEHVV